MTADTHIDHLAEVVFTIFLFCKLLFFFAVHTIFFGRKSLCAAHTESEESCEQSIYYEGL